MIYSQVGYGLHCKLQKNIDDMAWHKCAFLILMLDLCFFVLSRRVDDFEIYNYLKYIYKIYIYLYICWNINRWKTFDAGLFLKLGRATKITDGISRVVYSLYNWKTKIFIMITNLSWRFWFEQNAFGSETTASNKTMHWSCTFWYVVLIML